MVLASELERFARSFARELPPGFAWAFAPDSVALRALRGLGSEWAELEERRGAWLRERDVRTALELLPEWESFLGFPGECAGLAPTVALRQAAAHEKLTARGGTSLQALSDAAQSVGFDVEPGDIEENKAFRVGQSGAGEPLNGEPWAFAFTIHAPTESPSFFRAGESASGEELVATGNELLECVLASSVNAHNAVLFVYDKPYGGWAPWRELRMQPVTLNLEAPSVVAQGG